MSTELREAENNLLLSIFKGVATTKMNLDTVSVEMEITPRAAKERFIRLKAKLAKKPKNIRQVEKDLLVNIMKGLSNSDIDFVQVGNDFNISGRAAKERYLRLREKLWGKDKAIIGASSAIVASPSKATMNKNKSLRLNVEDEDMDSNQEDSETDLSVKASTSKNTYEMKTSKRKSGAGGTDMIKMERTASYEDDRGLHVTATPFSDKGRAKKHSSWFTSPYDSGKEDSPSDTKNGKAIRSLSDLEFDDDDDETSNSPMKSEASHEGLASESEDSDSEAFHDAHEKIHDDMDLDSDEDMV